MLCSWKTGWDHEQAGPRTVRINDPHGGRVHLFIQINILLRKRVGMFRSKRKDSAIRTLVAETLVLAKTHGYVEKIEHELEEELQRENTEPPNRILAKWRRTGEKMLKNKYTLLTVALFCVTECALILGELILDLHKVKVVLETQETEAKVFAERLYMLYPEYVYPGDKISVIYDNILKSKILWQLSSSDEHNTSDALQDGVDRHKRDAYMDETVWVISSDRKDSGSLQQNVTSSGRSSGGAAHVSAGFSHEHSLEEGIAHAFHLASITILSILVFQTVLKALCAGTAFFQRKLETFDLCIVLISFVVDLVCMQIMPRYKIQDFVFILAFLLPWRVIRVVNSLVVAVQDHEHFRLKLIYGRKKKIVNSLRESEIKLQLFRAQCNALKRLCFNEGIDESKIDQILMVEECVVNKTGKSKCKIKIDNSSVILLNDKSDFPRLSPRPSLLNLVEKIGVRRKSMQPPGAPPSGEREFFLNTKDSPKKRIFKSRARSNSESGFGTLSSPDDPTGHQNSFGESCAYSGLSTPIIINRKNSLNSPIMANYVRNILNSLEDKISQMNGGGGRLGGGRGSVDTESIAEEEDSAIRKQFGRKVHSIEEKTEGSMEYDSNGVSYLSKRRASLQPQKCVDEDDPDLAGAGTLAASTRLHLTSGGNNMAADDTAEHPAVYNHKFIHTTIQIDPPSVPSNYSLSSSFSSPSDGSVDNYPTKQSRFDNSFTLEASFVDNNTALPATPPKQTTIDSSEDTTSPSGSQTLITEDLKTSSAMLTSDNPEKYEQEKNPSSVSSNLRPKTLRTPSDIENQNSLAYSESTDICEPENNDDLRSHAPSAELGEGSRNNDNTACVTSPDQAAMAPTNNLDADQTLVNSLDIDHHGEDPQTFSQVTSCNGNIVCDPDSSMNSLGSRDAALYPSSSGSSVDPPEYILNCNTVLHFIG